MKNILFIASEAVPFIKTGGLADVVGSLPKCFDKQYFDVRVMIPKYLCIKESFRNEMKYVNHFYMDYLGQNRYVGILEYEYEGVTFYFIDNESYFWGDRPYGDWYYDLEKFSFFCKAALSSLPVIGFKPDVIHCHDWQTGLIPVHLKDKFHGGEFFRNSHFTAQIRHHDYFILLQHGQDVFCTFDCMHIIDSPHLPGNYRKRYCRSVQPVQLPGRRRFPSVFQQPHLYLPVR